MIAIRSMRASELARIREIDRSDHVTEEYVYRDGALEKRSVDIPVPDWSRAGTHEHSIPSRLAAWQPILDRGGTLVGAFEADRLVGFAVYQPRLDVDVANLSALYVSRSHRGTGVGSRLTHEVARLARRDGARALYVSATPNVATVEFYRRRGFALADPPNPALLALEPEDIHMILAL